jgi:hypothetical protein
MSHRDPISLITPEGVERTPRPRRRAPRRAGGHRAQLTVPVEMWQQVTRIAQAAGTTPNDVLVCLAAERLQDRERALILQRRADERWQAFAEADVANGVAMGALSEQELLELSAAFREDG